MASNVVGTPYSPPSRTAWGAIFGGTFIFLAIMVTFGSLGAAIFADVYSGLGFQVWMAVLGVISLYFAGRATGHLAGVTDRNVAMWHGLITFGMSVFTTVLVISLALISSVGGTRAAVATVSNANFWGTIGSTAGWALFCSLFVGFLGAAFGASHGVRPLRGGVAGQQESPDIRRVA